MPTTTPNEITADILDFSATISSAEPVYVPVVNVWTGSAGECFSNVAKHVEQSQGRRVLGWIVWERSGAFLEAEQHAVWETPTGELQDITPKPDRETRVLFLPDPDTTLAFAGRVGQVNRRKALTDDPLVTNFLEAAAHADPFNQKNRAGLLREGKEQAKFAKAAKKQSAAYLRMTSRFP